MLVSVSCLFYGGCGQYSRISSSLTAVDLIFAGSTAMNLSMNSINGQLLSYFHFPFGLRP
jgi:hypothetical protein